MQKIKTTTIVLASRPSRTTAAGGVRAVRVVCLCYTLAQAVHMKLMTPRMKTLPFLGLVLCPELAPSVGGVMSNAAGHR